MCKNLVERLLMWVQAWTSSRHQVILNLAAVYFILFSFDVGIILEM